MMQAATLLVTLLTLLATRPRRSKMRCAMTSTTSRPRPRASPRSACSRWTMMTLKLKSRPSSQMQLRNRGRADISQIGSACPHVPAMFLTVALAQDEVEKTVRAFCAEQKCVLFVHSTLIPVRLCRSSPEKQPLLLSLPAAQPKASLEKLAQLALNTLRAPHVLLVPSPVLEAVSPGSAPSVVIELSARVCSVVSLKLTNSTMRRRIQHDGDPSGQRARSCICHRCATCSSDRFTCSCCDCASGARVRRERLDRLPDENHGRTWLLLLDKVRLERCLRINVALSCLRRAERELLVSIKEVCCILLLASLIFRARRVSAKSPKITRRHCAWQHLRRR